jgi:hypothetical protein
MSGIIEGNNYNIFISYPQNDNKHYGGVTKFLDNLKVSHLSSIRD